MAIGINDLDFSDELGEEVQSQPGETGYYDYEDSIDQQKPWMGANGEMEDVPFNGNPVKPAEATETEEDIVISLLHNRGISDPSKIKFEGEDGELVERDWSELSREEQLLILDQQEIVDDWDEAEIQFRDFLRGSGMTVNEFIQWEREKAVNEHLALLEGNPSYEIDNIPDAELYVYDLQARVPEMTDEEAIEALELERQNPALFEKKMQGIRQEYKQIEDERKEQETYLEQQQQQEDFARYESDVIGAISNFKGIGNFQLDLTNEDVEEVADFLLSTDSAGVYYISKALDDPETLVRMAWFALKGEEAFESISEYYNNEITEVSKTNYQKGYEDGKAGKTPAKGKKSTVVVKQPENNDNKKVKSIHDLD